MNIPTIALKAGGKLSFAFFVALPEPAGSWTATSKICQSDGTEVADLAVTLEELETVEDDGMTHRVLVESTTDTTAWPLEVLEWDVCFTDADGVRLFTDTFGMDMQRSPSHA